MRPDVSSSMFCNFQLSKITVQPAITSHCSIMFNINWKWAHSTVKSIYISMYVYIYIIRQWTADVTFGYKKNWPGQGNTVQEDKLTFYKFFHGERVTANGNAASYWFFQCEVLLYCFLARSMPNVIYINSVSCFWRFFRPIDFCHFYVSENI